LSIWLLALIIALAGAVGGMANALLTDNGFIRWKAITVNDRTVWRPGFLGNVLLGAIAAFVSWGVYGRYAGVDVVGGGPGANVSETLGGIAGATLVGVGGARFLTSEVDKRMLQLAAAKAAAASPSAAAAASIATATPAQALEAAKNLA